jgi:4'-phosphopantetheinyl transferase EntD
LFTPREIEQLQQADPRLPGLMFSAKEAGYKAVHPLVGRFIGFQEAEVEVSWPDRTLQLRYVGDHEPNRIMERGIGHFCFFEGYVLTVFVIPRD